MTHSLTLGFAFIGGINIGLVVLWFVWLRRVIRRSRAAAAEAALKMSKLDELEKVAVDAVAEAKKQSERADAYFRVFERIEKERDIWREMYHEAGTGMSRGQSMLMEEIVRLSNALKRSEDPELRAMVNKFTKEHGSGAAPRAEEVAAKALKDKPPLLVDGVPVVGPPTQNAPNGPRD